MSYYGEETQKAVSNFGGGKMDREIISAYAIVKKSALKAVQKTENRFSDDEYKAITSACDEIISGMHDESFPLSMEQGGAGTSINMNINEVIASRAQEIFQENTKSHKQFDYISDINYYQSTNDTFPTAVTIALLRKLNLLEEKIIAFQHSLKDFENRHPNVMMTGRTEFQSALPITLAQVASAWTGPVERDRWRLHKIHERFRTIPLGGTALGTSFPATRNYIFEAENAVREFSGLNLSRSQNFTDDISSQDKFSELASAVKILSQNIFRISNDLMLYSSSFIGEMIHPDMQYGSTIMAAKTNPVLLEYSVGMSVKSQFHSDAAMRFCEMTSLQLNAYLPFIYDSLSESFRCASNALDTLSQKLFPHLEINTEKIEANLYSSNAMLNLLLPVIGYHAVKQLFEKSQSVKLNSRADFISFIKTETDISEDEILKIIDPVNSTSARKNK